MSFCEINRLQQDEQAPDDVGLREFDLVPGEESLQVLFGGLLSALETASSSGLVRAHEEQAVVVDNGDAKAVKPTGAAKEVPVECESWAKKTTAENSIPSV